jgi:hypothetical protein
MKVGVMLRHVNMKIQACCLVVVIYLDLVVRPGSDSMVLIAGARTRWFRRFGHAD